MSRLFERYRRLVYAQVMLGLAAFSIALSSPVFLLLVGAIAVGSWYLVEGPSGRSLPRYVTNLGALAAIAWLLMDLRLRSTPGLVAIGHFMIWLQLLLLYGRRDYRDDAMALVLSLLLMVDASLLSFSMVYGLLLAAYSLLMVWTLLAFSFSATAEEVTRRTRSLLADEQASIALIGGSRMRRDVARIGAAMSAAVFVVAAFVFVATPRIEGLGDAAAAHVLSGAASIGFNTEVQLGKHLIEPDSQEPVMLVVMRDGDGRSVGSNNRVWYLRGASMDGYDPYLRTWYRTPEVSQHDLLVPLRGNPGAVALATSTGSWSVLEAEITIRRPRQDHLFAPFPPLGLRSDSFRYAVFNAVDQQLFAQQRNSRTVRYTIRHAFPSPTDRAIFRDYFRQIGRRPRSQGPTPPTGARAPFDADAYGRGWPVQGDMVRAMADGILDRAGLHRDASAEHDPHDAVIAETLTSHLRNNFRYRITTNGVGAGDPVMEFLFTRREGHCELFAAGLAALARSIGMRARLVGGYLASEYNAAGGYYIVRPGNAHAWCEIEIGRDVWQRFDPTPPADRAMQHHVASTWARKLRQLYEHLDFLWIRSVVAYDPRTQQTVLTAARQSLQRAASLEDGLARQWHRLASWRRGGHGLTFAWALTGILILAFVAALAVNRVRRWRARRRGSPKMLVPAVRGGDARSHARQTGFYRTMVNLLARHGYERPLWQGPRQFAQDLAARHPQHFDAVPVLTDLFYAVRFGGHPLEESQRLEAQNRLKLLERNLRHVKALYEGRGD